jgi:hypothetical protein
MAISQDSSFEFGKTRRYTTVYTKSKDRKHEIDSVLDSEEAILPGKHEIVMTVDYQVEYEESEDSLSEKGLGGGVRDSWK